MRYNVSHYFEKELTWLMRSYYDCINKEAIGKVKVVQVAELRAVLRGRRVVMQQKRAPVLTILNL